MKVILTKGLPASGKTTWAKSFIKRNNNYLRINRDDLRYMLFPNTEWNMNKEKIVINARNEILLDALNNNYNVIIDETNLNQKNVKDIIDIIGDKAVIEIRDEFLEVPVIECIRRDEKRKNSVGKEVIMNMYNIYTYDTKSKAYKECENSYESNVNN